MEKFVYAVRKISGKGFRKLPRTGVVNFTLVTPLLDVHAGANIEDSKFQNLALTTRKDSLNIVSVARASLQNLQCSELARLQLGQGEEGIIEEWFTTDNTLEGIYRCQLFLRDLATIVQELEAKTRVSILS